MTTACLSRPRPALFGASYGVTSRADSSLREVEGHRTGEPRGTEHETQGRTR